MTKLLEKAFKKASQIPEIEQNTFRNEFMVYIVKITASI